MNFWPTIMDAYLKSGEKLADMAFEAQPPGQLNHRLGALSEL
jgi:hypothetical protein